MDSKNALAYNFIAIEGNIGAGKTTLCKMLSKDYNARLLLEQFSDNPFLPFFYENPERYAFSVELFFMTERHKQLQENLLNQDLFQQITISDYFFIKTLLFARKNLTTEEYRLFNRLFNVLNSTFPKPELLVYLHRPVEHLINNIKKRGRSYEQDISPDYLQHIQDAYFDYFKIETSIPILIFELDDIDFVQTPIYYQLIQKHLHQKYDNAIHRVTLSHELNAL